MGTSESKLAGIAIVQLFFWFFAVPTYAEDKMSQAQKDHLYRIARVLGLAALMGTVVAGVGCGGALSNSNNQTQTDPSPVAFIMVASRISK